MIQYIVISLVAIVTVVFVFIKLYYPFWNIQPVFHSYDFMRKLYSSPFHIYKYRPIKTKFCDFTRIRTADYLDATPQEKENILELIQCYYISTERILYNIMASDIDAYLTGFGEPVYISLYTESKYELIPMKINTPNVYPTISGEAESIIDVITIEKPIGCILSRPATLYYYDPTAYKKKPLIIYVIDYLCVHREKTTEKDRKLVNRKLLQTHEYNQRSKNPNSITTIIKKEIELFDGVVPLLYYNTYTFYLRNIHFPRLPPHVEVIQIQKDNTELLYDYVYSGEQALTSNRFDIIILADFGNILAQINQRLLYVYCLRKQGTILGFYFIKNAKMQYDDIDGKTLHLMSSILMLQSITPIQEQMFYLGYLSSLRQIIKREPEYKMLLFEDIGHNKILYEYWREKHTPVFINKTAYYSFNWVYPCSPIPNHRCFILQ